MKISLLHPSRGRPFPADKTVRRWVSNSGIDIDDFEHIYSLDSDDPTVIEYRRCDMLLVDDNHSVVEATNRAAKEAKGDILVYLSDDFDCPENWGQLILKEFENEDRPLVIKVDDCYQPCGTPVLTIPIMNRKLYEKLGYFWHPEYKSMFCDEHLYWVTRKIGALKMAEHLKFPHEHKKQGDDATYQRSAANWKQGQDLFRLHRGQGFPI